MTVVRLLPIALCVLFGGATFAACASDEPRRDEEEEDDEQQPSKTVWETLEECKLTGQLRVKTAPMSTCEEWPLEGEIVSVEGTGNAVILRAGLLELPIAAGASACSFVAAGCASTPASENGPDARYFAPEMALSASGAGAQLVAQAVDVVGSYAGPCKEATFELVAAETKACDPVGEYEASAEASILTGACDLTWGPGKVTVTSSAEGYAVDWAGTSIDELKLDPATCSLSGSKGLPPSFWSYNSANRSVEIELRFADGSLKGTVKDKLDGMTFDGKTCAGATFELLASKPPPRETHPLMPACSEPPPPVCGDGVCETGEGCTWCDDCACGDGATCAPDSVCRTPCTLQTEATACAAGERCSPVGSSYKTAIFPDENLYCEAAGAGKKGDVCSKTNDCGAGLLCHTAVSSTKGRCSPPCGDGFPDCIDPAVCSSHGDGSGQGSYPTAVMGCEHKAGAGEDCSIDSCQNQFKCIEHCINGVCSNYCSQPCGSCPPEIPVCQFGYCVKE